MNKQINANRLVQDIEEGIIVIDNDGVIFSINPKAKTILNVNDDYVGKNVLIYSKLISSNF